MFLDLRTLDFDLLNFHGAWEPCLEPFSGTLQVESTTDGMTGTRLLRLSGRSPLLVNLSPSMVQRCAWLLKAFSRDATPGGRRPSAGTAGFRVINICEFPIEIRDSRGDLQSTMVQPTGSLWEPLDDWVLQNSVKALQLRLPQGDWSQELPLDCAGCKLSRKVIGFAIWFL
eukprot:symbB.v1.2.008475.t1/scaffold534.1/size190675/6